MNSRPKAFWRYINSRIKIHPNIAELLCSNGSTVNEYFSSVFTVEDTTTIPTVHSVCSPPVIDYYPRAGCPE